MLSPSSIFALTWYTARKAEPLTNQEVVLKLTTIIAENGYIEESQCRSHEFVCADGTRRTIHCDEHGVFNYHPMSMVLFSIFKIRDSENQRF